jgi:MFS family permease
MYTVRIIEQYPFFAMDSSPLVSNRRRFPRSGKALLLLRRRALRGLSPHRTDWRIVCNPAIFEHCSKKTRRSCRACRAQGNPHVPHGGVKMVEKRSASAQGAQRRAAYPWYVLGVLLLVYALHHMDRQIVTLLLEPIKHEFGLSDSQLGFLAGLCYAIAFAVGGIPLGLLVDRVHRVRLLAVLIAIWSGLTALCGIANSYLWLVLARVGVATAESGATPTNLSVLSDYFSPRRRAGAVGIYTMGPHIGTVIGFAVAAVVAQAWGWRAAFLIAGLPGLLLMGLVLATVREPRRGAAEDHPAAAAKAEVAPPLWETMKLIASQRAQRNAIAGIVLAMCVAAGLGAWQAPFLIRTFGVDLRAAGLSLAFAVATAGAFGAWFGGWLAGRMGRGDTARIPRLTAFSIFMTIPAALWAIFAGSFVQAVAGFAVQNFFVAMTVASGYGLCLSLSGPRTRGTTMALLQVLSNVVGYGVGPQLVGLLSDRLPPAAHGGSLIYAMALLNLISVWAMLHLLIAARWTRGDLAKMMAVTPAA